jgi:hypothetical protein
MSRPIVTSGIPTKRQAMSEKVKPGYNREVKEAAQMPEA